MSIVPRSARYNVLPMGVPSQRRSVRQGVQSGNKFKPEETKIIRINLPQQSYLDCANTYLTFRHKICDANSATDAQTDLLTNLMNTANSETCMDNGAFSWIRNIQVQGADGSVLENIQNYNVLSRVLHRATQPNDHNETSASVLQGYGDISERQGWGVNSTGHTYAIQLSASGILSNSKYLPLKYLQGGLTLQIELDDFNRCHQASGTGSYSYVIDQVHLHMDLVDFSDEFDAMFRNQLASEGVNIHFDTYSSHIDTLGTQAGEVNLEISERASSVKSVYTILRETANVSSVATDSTGSWTCRETTKYKYTLGTTDYPRFEVSCEGGGAICYAEMLKGFGALGDVNGGSEIDAHSWRGKSSNALDKYLEIVSVMPHAYMGSANASYAVFVFTGKHALSSGTNAIGTGDQFLVLNTGSTIINAGGVANANAHQQANGVWICEAVLSDKSALCVLSQGALGGAYAETAGSIAETAVVSQGYAKFQSSATDGKDAKFMIAQNFENHFENQMLQTGVSASGAVPLSLTLQCDGATACRVDTFVHSDKMLTIGADGLASVSV